MKKESYVFSLDVIRVAAIIGVVIIHTFNAVHARPDFVGGSTWWFANVFESLARTSIPLFILISGYLILNKPESFAKTIKRIGLRILVPLFSMLALYIYWNAGNPSLDGFGTYFTRLYSGGVFHLYFLIIIAGLYLTTPFLRSFIPSVSVKVQQRIVGLFLGIGIIFVAGQYYFNLCQSVNSFSMWIPYIGYFLAGNILGRNKVRTSTVWLWVLFISGFAVTVYFNYFHLVQIQQGTTSLHPNGCISPYFDNYVSPNVMMMSVSTFLLLVHHQFIFLSKGFIGKLIQSIARASLGIYLIHILIIQVLETTFNFQIENYSYSLISFLLIKWLIVFVLSYLSALVLMKIPVIRWAFGEK